MARSVVNASGLSGSAVSAKASCRSPLSVVFRQCGEVANRGNGDSGPGAIAPKQCGVVG